MKNKLENLYNKTHLLSVEEPELLETLSGKLVVCVSCKESYVFDTANKTSFLVCSNCRGDIIEKNLEQILSVLSYLLCNIPKDSPLNKPTDGFSFEDHMEVLLGCMQEGYILADFNCRLNTDKTH